METLNLAQELRDTVICYRLVEGDWPGIVLHTSQYKEKKPAITELKAWAKENGWTLIECEGGKGNCFIQELVAV